MPITNPALPPPRFGTTFRVGSTSYVYPDDILPNVEKLAAAGEVDDIELILFEVDDGPNNIPSEAIIQQIDQLARQANITYTVHLPLDLTLAADSSAQHASLIKAQRVIERTLPLDPFAFVFHLDGKGVESPGWVDNALRALDVVMGWIPDPARLAVENLENYPPDYLDPVLARAPISRTTDVGHFWKMGLNPVDYLPVWLPRTRVIHIHGMAERDHHSLALMQPEQLDPVVRLLLEAQYSGVITLEVFETMDFFTSQVALLASLDREGETGMYTAFATTRSSEDLIKLAIEVPDWDMAWLPIIQLHGRTDRNTFEQSAALCHSEDADERMVGAYILGQIGYSEERPFEEETLDILLNMLETEQNTDVIDSVLNALGFISNERVIEPVLKWKDHPDDSIRFHVVFNCTYNDERVIQALLQFSRDPDNDVRDWACMWLSSLIEWYGLQREDIHAALWERIEAEDHYGGYGEAMVGLARLKDHRVTPHILRWLHHDYLDTLAFQAADESHDPELYREMLNLRAQWDNDQTVSETHRHWLNDSIETCAKNIEGRETEN